MATQLPSSRVTSKLVPRAVVAMTRLAVVGAAWMRADGKVIVNSVSCA
jgi:hypothetical protein